MRRITYRQRLRHRLIAEWRGVPDGPLIDEPAVGVAALLAGVLKDWKLKDSLTAEEVTAAWVEIVGVFMAQHTAPDGLKRGVLTVRVLQPAVHHAIRSQKAGLLTRLQERFGQDAVRDLKFRHG